MESNRFVRWFALISGLVYLISGLIFALFPVSLVEILVRISGMSRHMVIAPSFWHPLAVSMMAMLVVCSLFVWQDPEKNRVFFIPIIVSKFTSSFFSVISVLAGHPTVLLIIFVVDFPLFLATLLVYRTIPRMGEQ